MNLENTIKWFIEEFKNEDTSQKGGSIRDYLDSFSKDEILKAMKQIIKKNSS